LLHLVGFKIALLVLSYRQLIYALLIC
jgi:hypothetical protein